MNSSPDIHRRKEKICESTKILFWIVPNYTEKQSWLRLHHVFALATWGGRLYWSDWETRAVESCRRRPLPAALLRLRHDNDTTDGSGAWRCDPLLHTVHKPMDLRLFHPARQPPEPGTNE